MEDPGVVVKDTDQTMVLLDCPERVAHPIEISQVALIVWPVPFALCAHVDADRQEPGLRQLPTRGLTDQAIAASDYRNLHDYLPLILTLAKDCHVGTEGGNRTAGVVRTNAPPECRGAEAPISRDGR
jgi:hypothetical protein